MAHPLSLAFLTVFDAGPVEAVRIAAETGYDRVGLRFLPARDLAHDGLDHEHALRSAEAAKGGAALLVGAAAPAVDRDML